MKPTRFFAAFFLFFIINLTLSQKEVERYRLPEIIEGSNLIISASPFYNDRHQSDNEKISYLNLGVSADFTKWRFTPGLDYSIHLKPIYSFNRVKTVYNTEEDYYKSSRGRLLVEGGISHYPFRSPVYGGFYFSTQSIYSNETKPSSNNNLYTYIGYGRLVNAGQVIYAKNFEDVLLEEKIISKRMHNKALSNLTELLDKRFNREFYSKYKDDADIEFFTEIESLLIDEKIINAPLNSRTVLKLYQALTNFSFVYYPRYKGYLAQLELNYTNISQRSNYNSEFHNNLTLLISGLYGLPAGLKTNFVFTAYAGIPLNDRSKLPIINGIFHSPITLRENYSVYPLINPALDYNIRYEYFTGAKIIAFHNLSATAGISGFCNFNFGNTHNKNRNYAVDTQLSFRYNLLSEIYTNAFARLSKLGSSMLEFSSGIEFNMIVF